MRNRDLRLRVVALIRGVPVTTYTGHRAAFHRALDHAAGARAAGWPAFIVEVEV